MNSLTVISIIAITCNLIILVNTQYDNIDQNVEFLMEFYQNSELNQFKMRLGYDGKPLLVNQRIGYQFLNAINESLPVYLIIHGWQSSLDKNKFKLIMRRISSRKFGNAIGVDWAPLARRTYLQSVRLLPAIAEHIVKFLILLKRTKGIAPSTVSIVGHSLGAHIAGFVGKRVNNLKRIDGLDPAGPAFFTASDSKRLCSTDAKFVTIIHSDTVNYGIGFSIGHADFYPNGGSLQPGCRSFTDLAGCSHAKSIHYYYRSINEIFKSAKCDSYKEFQNGNCLFQRAYMGFHAQPSLRGDYYIYLND